MPQESDHTHPARPWTLAERMDVFVQLLLHRPGMGRQEIKDTIAQAQQGCSAQDYITFLQDSSQAVQAQPDTWQDKAAGPERMREGKGRR